MNSKKLYNFCGAKTGKKFQRRKEDFVCEHCGYRVKGNGYTNHCPECLYSKHVDNSPGDRAADCGGLMIVSDIELAGGQYIFTHTCQKCGHAKRNKQATQDNLSSILAAGKRLHI